jgi:hypothetical protein
MQPYLDSYKLAGVIGSTGGDQWAARDTFLKTAVRSLFVQVAL